LEYDEQIGIDWSFLAADGAMTKAPLGGPITGPNPTVEPKGAKRPVLTDAAGAPVGIDHYGANRNDHKLLKAKLDSIAIDRAGPTPEQPQGLCLDKAYDNSEVRELVAEYGFTGRIRAGGEEIADKALTPGWRARRWVVEACHWWLPQPRDLDPLV
jgi:putative transposase